MQEDAVRRDEAQHHPGASKQAPKQVSPWTLEVCEGLCCLEELLVFEHLQMRQVMMSRWKSPMSKTSYKSKHRGPGRR